jgi:hypothetical protein
MRLVSKVPLDCDGVRLKVGDPVDSTEDYCLGQTHSGQIVKTLRGPVEVRHDEGCCHEPSNPSRVWRSAAFLWRRRST